MIEPSPTTTIEPGIARGTLEKIIPAGDDAPLQVVLTFPNTSYELRLIATGPIQAAEGSRIIGTIRADAHRVDIVQTGGRFIEPVFGPPHRIQGTIISADNTSNTLTINAGIPIVCKLTDPRQRAVAFEPGQLVACDLRPGCSFSEQQSRT